MSYIARVPYRADDTNEIQVDEYETGGWSLVRTDSLGDHLDRIYARIAELEAELRAMKDKS